MNIIRTLRTKTPAEFFNIRSQLQAGDRVLIGPGKWQNFTIDLVSNGLADRPILIEVEQPSQTTFQNVQFRLAGQNLVLKNFVFQMEDRPALIFRIEGYANCNRCRVIDSAFYDLPSKPSVAKPAWVIVFGKQNMVANSFFSGMLGSDMPFVWLPSQDGSVQDHHILNNYFGDRPYVNASFDGEALVVGSGPVFINGQSVRPRVKNKVYRNAFCNLRREDEIISIKSSENLFFQNMFENNSGAISFRFSDYSRAISNVINGSNSSASKGFIVMGRGNQILNNFVGQTTAGAIHLYSGSDQIDPNDKDYRYPRTEDTLVGANTLYGSKDSVFRFGNQALVNGIAASVPAKNSLIINNLIQSSSAPKLFSFHQSLPAPATTEIRAYNNIYWKGYYGDFALGDFRVIDPLTQSIYGLRQPSSSSPAVGRGDGWLDLEFDLAGQCRALAKNTIGALEATKFASAPWWSTVRTGPRYNISFLFTRGVVKPSCSFARSY